MQFDERGQQILGAVWVVLGILLPIFYLTPLFGTVLYDLNGIDVITAMDDLSDDKLRTFDQLSGVLMVILPQVMIFLGFMALGLGIHSLATKKGTLILPYIILALVTMIAGLFCAIRLAGESNGFFAMVKPTAQFGFYFMITILALIVLAPILISALLPSQEKATF